MGLDCSHDAFHGGYSAFNRFRKAVATAAGGSYPPHQPTYRLQDGSPPNPDWYYFDDEVVPPEHNEAAKLFFSHSDCDGIFTPEECVKVAAFLRWAAPRIDKTPGGGHLSWATSGLGEVAVKFARGCELAAEEGVNLEFY